VCREGWSATFRSLPEKEARPMRTALADTPRRDTHRRRFARAAAAAEGRE
jgi:hypothetical protein